MVLIIILVIIIVIIGGLVAIYNGIVGARNRCDNAWQTIDAQLQRRNDLIPNLVNTVKGYAAHESGTLEAVTNARAAVANAGTPEAKMAANDQLSGALNHLFAVAEAYPDLKANTNFLQLQSDLTDTENKISYARQSYNDCVLSYNNAIQTFPGNLIAGFGNFQPKNGFQASDSARVAPTVDFGTTPGVPVAPSVNMGAQAAPASQQQPPTPPAQQ
jgi:LemA protein